jgi:hypothetical protein
VGNQYTKPIIIYSEQTNYRSEYAEQSIVLGFEFGCAVSCSCRAGLLNVSVRYKCLENQLRVYADNLFRIDDFLDLGNHISDEHVERIPETTVELKGE